MQTTTVKPKEVLSNSNSNTDEFTSLRVSRRTADALAARGKFRDTFDDIVQRLLAESDNGDKLQPIAGGSF
ncbi:hypothetical protein BH18THE2_BH18THE2_09260 [soil metagenome]